MVQSRTIAENLKTKFPRFDFEIIEFKSAGDKNQNAPFLEMAASPGIFTRDLDLAVLEGRLDMAVHSAKDLPTRLLPGIEIGAMPEREDSRDAFLSLEASSLKDLKPGAKVGTASPRRQAQLLHFRQDLKILSLRGNVDTRLKKLETGEVDAVVVAYAGLKRLGLEKRVSEALSSLDFPSAAGQGAIAVCQRDGDAEIKEILSILRHEDTILRVEAERKLLATLDGGCHVPLGVETSLNKNEMVMRAAVYSLDGKQKITAEKKTARGMSLCLAEDLGRELLAAGAGALL